jgi:hypothetical protein
VTLVVEMALWSRWPYGRDGVVVEMGVNEPSALLGSAFMGPE